MKTNTLDIVLGPTETYEDELFGYKAANEAFVLVKDQAWSKRLSHFAAELPELIRWAHGRDLDITLIETMPMGEVEADRTDQYLSLTRLRTQLESFWTLRDIPLTTAGPARYVQVAAPGGRRGFSPPPRHHLQPPCPPVRAHRSLRFGRDVWPVNPPDVSG